jgi:toxin CcdB
MHQFDICSLRDSRGRETKNWVAILQHNRLSDLRSRLVAPLADTASMRQVKRLHPMVSFRGQQYILAVEQMGTVDVMHLGPPVGSIEHLRYEIISAIDFLFTGT